MSSGASSPSAPGPRWPPLPLPVLMSACPPRAGLAAGDAHLKARGSMTGARGTSHHSIGRTHGWAYTWLESWGWEHVPGACGEEARVRQRSEPSTAMHVTSTVDTREGRRDQHVPGDGCLAVHSTCQGVESRHLLRQRTSSQAPAPARELCKHSRHTAQLRHALLAGSRGGSRATLGNIPCMFILPAGRPCGWHSRTCRWS